jgi:predicted CopG family antitoxin
VYACTQLISPGTHTKLTGVDELSTTIRVRVDVKKRLEELKREMGLRSHSEVVEKLLEGATDPRATLEHLIYWVIDMRRDVKKLIELLERLVAALEALKRSTSGGS